MIYAQRSSAMMKLLNPVEVNLSFPNETSGRVVYVENLAIGDFLEFAEETTVGEAPATDEADSGGSGTGAKQDKQAQQDGDSAENSGGSTISVLIQRMPMDSAEEASNEVYAVSMDSKTFETLASSGLPAPDMGGGDALDLDEVARMIFDDVKERLALERERLQPFA